MSSQIIFPLRLSSPSNNLPLTLISLEDWALITLNGPDSIQYLQHQLTCDIESLKATHFSFSAHCNAKGKMLSYLLVLHYHAGFALICRRSVRERQTAELKKYAVFSKTTISVDDKLILLGVAGFRARAMLKRFFSDIPDAICPLKHHKNTTLLYFNMPTPRFLLITTRKTGIDLQQRLEEKSIQFSNSQQWLALDIEAGYPIIDNANSEKFIPQAANINNALHGISFNKGCYIGQEVVARAKYCGSNSRELYWLESRCNHFPSAGDHIDLKMNQGWRKTGTVLGACRLSESKIWVQAILTKNLKPDSLLRVRGDDGTLTIQSTSCVVDDQGFHDRAGCFQIIKGASCRQTASRATSKKVEILKKQTNILPKITRTSVE